MAASSPQNFQIPGDVRIHASLLVCLQRETAQEGEFLRQFSTVLPAVITQHTAQVKHKHLLEKQAWPAPL
jgi:hypothetical protein